MPSSPEGFETATPSQTLAYRSRKTLAGRLPRPSDTSVTLSGRLPRPSDTSVTLSGRLPGLSDTLVMLSGRLPGLSDTPVMLSGRLPGPSNTLVMLSGRLPEPSDTSVTLSGRLPEATAQKWARKSPLRGDSPPPIGLTAGLRLGLRMWRKGLLLRPDYYQTC